MTFRLLAWTGPGGSVVAAEALKCDPQSESPRCRCADTLPMARERKVQEEKAVWGFAYQLTVITLGQLATFPCATLISPSGSVQQSRISSIFVTMQPKPERNVSVEPIKIETSLSYMLLWCYAARAGVKGVYMSLMWKFNCVDVFRA